MTKQEERILQMASAGWIPRSHITLKISHGASSVIRDLLRRGLLESKWSESGMESDTGGGRRGAPALLVRAVRGWRTKMTEAA